jgi:hypothetical protein
MGASAPGCYANARGADWRGGRPGSTVSFAERNSAAAA